MRLTLCALLVLVACTRLESPVAPPEPVPCTPGTADTAVVIVINGVPYKEVVQCGTGKKK